MIDVREQIASQTEMILLYLQTHGAITPLDALREFGCMRLGARIWDLRKRGVPIVTTIKESKNSFGATVRYAVYTLLKPERSTTDYEQ